MAQLKVAKEPRRQLLEGLLADALLRSRAAARQLTAHRALAVVGARRLSPRLCAHIRSYGRRFGESQAFGLVDAEGRLELHGAGLESVKVRAPVRSASQLAALAKVSVSSAARFVSVLRSAGHLALRNGSLSLVRPAELVQRWSAAVRPTRELPARWILPATNLRRQLAGNLAAYVERLSPPPGEAGPFAFERPRMPSRIRACLGLFAAAEQMGLEAPRASPMHLYVEKASAAVLEQLGLVPARPGEVVHVWVRPARYPESLFRAAVTFHPARGAELAERLWRKRIQQALAARG